MPNRIDSSQLGLFPKDPRDLADAIGLDWWAAKKLYDDEWLSFDPETSLIDNFGMETEFVFLGSLVSAGCTPRILSKLLNRLEKPYLYDIREVFYDWASKMWKDLPSQIPREETAEEIICELEDQEDIDSLLEIKEMLQEAIDRLSAGEEVGKDD